MDNNLYHVFAVSFAVVFFSVMVLLLTYRLRPELATTTSPARQLPPLNPVRLIEATDRHAGSRVNWEHRANKGVLSALRETWPGGILEDTPVKKGVHLTGCRPNITMYVFDVLGSDLPETCRWVVYGYPVLVHPETGVIFAFGIGSDGVALRLPPTDRSIHWIDRYPMDDENVDTVGMGDDWAFMYGIAGTDDPIVAYAYAGRLVS